MSIQTDPTNHPEEHDGRSATPLVAAMVIIALAVVTYYALGMPGMDHTTSSSSNRMSTHAHHRLVDRSAFEKIVAEPATVTVNVHVPATAIHLDGTDLTMPFDELVPAELPTDRSTPLAVYCRSGEMSSIAVRRLLALGYVNVIELEGGTDAGRAGRPT